jgi:hypothetical protein
LEAAIQTEKTRHERAACAERNSCRHRRGR